MDVSPELLMAIRRSYVNDAESPECGDEYDIFLSNMLRNLADIELASNAIYEQRRRIHQELDAKLLEIQIQCPHYITKPTSPTSHHSGERCVVCGFIEMIPF